MPFLLPIHIAAGGLAVIFGFAALAFSKGAWSHRRVGHWFVYAMLAMGATASVLGLRKGNGLGGVMSAYFVITGLTTIRPVSAWTRRLNVGALVVAVLLAGVDVWFGVKALSMPRGMLDGVPFQMLFFLGTIMAMAAIGDVRVMRSGPLVGRRRLARHLWRMCFALFIAAGSFFSIRSRVAKVLPDFLATPAFQFLPILLIFVAMFYWLWRVRGRRPIPERR